MNRLSILYVGTDTGTSSHRARALQRLGHDVFIINPSVFLPDSHAISLWTWKSGGLFLGEFVRRRVLENIAARRFNLVLVNAGELVAPSLVAQLKGNCGPVINYNNDDPFGKRDGRRWRLYLEAVPSYDLIVVVRDCNVSEAFARGAQNVLRVYMSADEAAHSPRPITEQDRRRWSSEVVFIGTWMPERGPFMARLIELGIPLSIFGNRWNRAPEWGRLRPFWRGPGLEDEGEYAKAIQCSKVCLGLLSKGNRDLTTQRSFEIPHLGGVLCAERTSEHSALYREDEEAVFWDSPEECVAKCTTLLENEHFRKRLAMNGRCRCLQNRTTNEYVMARILDQVCPKLI
jgi:spore maturation protein CgeB